MFHSYYGITMSRSNLSCFSYSYFHHLVHHLLDFFSSPTRLFYLFDSSDGRKIRHERLFVHRCSRHQLLAPLDNTELNTEPVSTVDLQRDSSASKIPPSTFVRRSITNREKLTRYCLNALVVSSILADSDRWIRYTTTENISFAKLFGKAKFHLRLREMNTCH